MKKYTEMTPAERLADRIAKNRATDVRIVEKMAPVKARVDRGVARLDRMVGAFLAIAPKMTDGQVAASLEEMAKVAKGAVHQKDLDKMKAYAVHLKNV